MGERQSYVRQLRTMKGSVALDDVDADALRDCAGTCGRLLAEGHARTSGASMIAGYLGGSDEVDVALCAFAWRYADQTERSRGMIRDTDPEIIEHGRSARR